MRKDSAIALDGLEHNFYFTLELHTTFVYKSRDLSLHEHIVLPQASGQLRHGLLKVVTSSHFVEMMMFGFSCSLAALAALKLPWLWRWLPVLPALHT